jgi:hypothetical protein
LDKFSVFLAKLNDSLFLKDVGYDYAIDILPRLIRTNNHLKTLVNQERLISLMRTSSNAFRDGSRSLHNSFTDLAAQLSRIPVKSYRSLDDLNKLLDDEEDEEEEEEEVEQGKTRIIGTT